MFPTIIEKVEEEEKAAKETAKSPPSPLTELYDGLTLKQRHTWPRFLGDWAFVDGVPHHGGNFLTGVITLNQIPLTTIVTYLQKSYRSRISNHWATIPACSAVPPIYKQSILAIYRKFTVATVRFTQNVSCNIYIHPRYQQVANVTV